jgi:hypothetical protein
MSPHSASLRGGDQYHNTEGDSSRARGLLDISPSVFIGMKQTYQAMHLTPSRVAFTFTDD